MRSPAFQFYPKDYESDEHVKLMTLEQEGAYLRLLCHAWLHGSIPAEVRALALICRVPTAKMARLWPGVKPCWKDAGDGRLVNGRQERDRVSQQARRVVSEEKGRKGAQKRWSKHSPSHQPGHPPATPQAMPGDGFASASASATARRTDGPAPERPNPLVSETDRDQWELESLRLVREIEAARLSRQRAGHALAADEPVDGVEIFARAAHYEGAAPGRTKCNPATMRRDRLVNTVLDLRATLKAEQAKAPA